ncbi:hypothetical protein GBAR_LOCUS10260, partial [Geodia barretti]
HQAAYENRTTGTFPVTTSAWNTRTLNCTRGYQETCSVNFAWIFCRAALLRRLNPIESGGGVVVEARGWVVRVRGRKVRGFLSSGCHGTRRGRHSRNGR